MAAQGCTDVVPAPATALFARRVGTGCRRSSVVDDREGALYCALSALMQRRSLGRLTPNILAAALTFPLHASRAARTALVFTS
jgi:hypothetical protein